ncbi:MAG TPA: sulfotransferase [Xanthomonadaceae bacterium]|nr:sulfotransferase [Xanthomonadaceae bacterium]
MSESNDRHWRRFHAYVAQGMLLPARATLEALVARDPAEVRAHLLLCEIAWKDDRLRDSVRHAMDAARVVPDDAGLIVAVVAALVRSGECTLARECLQRPFLAGIDDPTLLWQLAGLQHGLDDHPAAMALFERAYARAVVETAPEFRFDYALELSINGRLQEAETELEGCAATGTSIGRVHVELARLRRQTPAHNHLALLDRQLALAEPGSVDQAGIEFARYKELEDLERHDEAWSALAHANALMAARTHYDAALEQGLHDRLRDAFPANFTRDVDGADEGPLPIFVIGMSRSGTTLLDRILGSHSQVRSAGELEDFGRQLRHVAGRCTLDMLDEQILARLPDLDYAELGRRYLAQTRWSARRRSFYVDKLPGNWRLAGPIRRSLPRARILNLVRDPMDVCFSNFRIFHGEVGGWSYRLSSVAHWYLEYRKIMAHWHAVMPGEILDVGYAELVRDPESTMRGVFAFCGLEYEQGCLDLARNPASVATLSMAQVRGSIHADAFEEWRPYATQLAELRLALA